MAKIDEKDKNTTSDGYAYLTKRIIVSKAKAAGKVASKKAMEVMGYVVVEEKGKIVKKNADGTIEVLSTVAVEPKTGDINLD